MSNGPVNKLEACYIRPHVYIGYGAMGVYPADNPIKLAIAAWKWGTYLGDDALAHGMRARVSSFTRHHVNVSMTRGKISGYYVNSILAKREAKADGYDEAILLDPEGYVSEGTGENIFIVRRGRIKTTPLTSILEGITRNSVIELAGEQGIPVLEERFTRDEITSPTKSSDGNRGRTDPRARDRHRRAAPVSRGPSPSVCKSFLNRAGRRCGHAAWLTALTGREKPLSIAQLAPGRLTNSAARTNAMLVIPRIVRPSTYLKPYAFGLSVIAALPNDPFEQPKR